VLRGGYDPEQHLEDMALDGVAREVPYPIVGLNTARVYHFDVAKLTIPRWRFEQASLDVKPGEIVDVTITFPSDSGGG
jgi:hypothetical protein